ncbi:MAG: hypothetical protein K2W95_33590 [Candidatus Obscuribacterales bacterium]|nr:hypothetical protein [Candidatus Obscuribacterales bacterium]
MRTEEFESRADEKRDGGGIATDELYNELSTLAKGGAESKPEALPSLTITDGAVKAKADSSATVKALAESKWLASLKPQELEAASKAFKEMGVKASSPAEITAECKKLVSALESDEYETREKAKDALQKVGKAALPAVLSGMTSEDPHVRRECGRIAFPLLRPAAGIIDAHLKLRDVLHRDSELQERDDQNGVDVKRLDLRKPLIALPTGMSKDEAEALQRVKDLVTGIEKEATGRKIGPTEQEKIAIEKMKTTIAEQEESAREVKAHMPEMLARTAALMADPVANPNGINLKDLGDTIKRAIAAGAKPDNEHIQDAMARVVLIGGKNPPADVVAAFKKAGGDLSTLPAVQHLENENALDSPPPRK